MDEKESHHIAIDSEYILSATILSISIT